MEETQDQENPVIQKVEEKDASSLVAISGHPLHAMSVHFPIAFVFATFGVDILYWWTGDGFWLRVGLWSSGGAFFLGMVAGAVGTAELLLVPGIRARVASWAHAIAAMTLIAVMGANWGVRATNLLDVLPQGLFLSGLSAVLTGIAGWHGGKLIFDHGVGLMVSSKD
ncbi:DUF2231 domain-containing protein (plasmid) [Shinella yambaruensis]|uniref:DUF2231 domain-containing protein n=1 Tax=Shinella yambaruensis TaxID=415996 RepID=UPI003D7BFD56